MALPTAAPVLELDAIETLLPAKDDEMLIVEVLRSRRWYGGCGPG